MIISTALMAVAAAIVLVLGYGRGHGEHLLGVKNGMGVFLQVLPLLALTFIVIGTLPILIPREWVVKWIGTESGARGLLAGTVAGGLAPGGPLIQSIIAAGLFKSGAGLGTIVAFLTAGMLWGLALLPVEAGVLGWKIVAARFACSFFFPPIAGWLAQTLFSGWIK
ncbi:MAG: permease [Candidatus Sumerlaeota bacterium]|nr:permease [Candidatus Sumerlaeota bacterium]